MPTKSTFTCETSPDTCYHKEPQSRERERALHLTSSAMARTSKTNGHFIASTAMKIISVRQPKIVVLYRGAVRQLGVPATGDTVTVKHVLLTKTAREAIRIMEHQALQATPGLATAMMDKTTSAPCAPMRANARAGSSAHGMQVVWVAKIRTRFRPFATRIRRRCPRLS
jgi:hypothetical protein